jgi:proteasome-associated ATPase
LDIKIKISRPDATSAREIFAKYVTADLPFTAEEIERHGGDRGVMVERLVGMTVDSMYAASEENKFLEVTYANGEKETLYFKDFSSGAVIEGIVSRAKKFAIKRAIATNEKGLKADDLLRAIREEFKEHEDLPNTTNPDDWAKIAGKKGEKIVHVRTITAGSNESRSIETISTGHYF